MNLKKQCHQKKQDQGSQGNRGKHGIIKRGDRSVACGGNVSHESITMPLLLSYQLEMVPYLYQYHMCLNLKNENKNKDDNDFIENLQLKHKTYRKATYAGNVGNAGSFFSDCHDSHKLIAVPFIKVACEPPRAGCLDDDARKITDDTLG